MKGKVNQNYNKQGIDIQHLVWHILTQLRYSSKSRRHDGVLGLSPLTWRKYIRLLLKHHNISHSGINDSKFLKHVEIN